VGRPSNNRRVGIALAIVALLSARTRAARAELPRLEADDVPGCPTSTELRSAIATHLGRDPFDDADAPRVAVRVKRKDETVSADVALGETHRELEGASCEEVVRAAALSLALAIEREAPRPAPPPPPMPPATPPATTRTPAPAPPRDIGDDRVVASGSLTTTVGLLPRPAPGAGLSARVRIADRAWLSARGFALPQAAMPNERFALRLFAGGAGACVEPWTKGAAAAVGCGHLLVGSFEVVDAQERMLSPTAALYLAASLSAGARVRVVGPFTLEGAVDAQLPFTRPTFLAATCPPTGFEPPFAALAVWLGAGVSVR
jgi:hypothetical protein